MQKNSTKTLTKTQTKNNKNKEQHSFLHNPKLVRVLLQRCHFPLILGLIFDEFPIFCGDFWMNFVYQKNYKKHWKALETIKVLVH